jgi:predicted O-methyltransferase YrrM
MQKQAELAPLLALLMRVRPQRVLEIGTARGGTLWAWCRVAAPSATIVSVDLPGGPFGGTAHDGSLVRTFAGPRQKLELLAGDSHAPGIEAEVRALLGGPVDFLFIDGDHSYDGVRADYDTYAPLVRDGGLIALHDIVPGPAEHVGEVPRFWRDLGHRDGVREIVDDIGSGGSEVPGCYGIGLVTRSGPAG